ncbi:carbohydrate porin [Novosphingobium sp. 11B]
MPVSNALAAALALSSAQAANPELPFGSPLIVSIRPVDQQSAESTAAPVSRQSDAGDAPLKLDADKHPSTKPAGQAEAGSGISGFQSTSPIGRGLRRLKRDGVTLNFDVVDNVAGNPIGGNDQGVRESRWVSAGTDVDLEKLLGWSGTKLHVHGAWFTGDSLGREVIGNSISFQQTWRPVSGPRLTQLNIEHDFGKLNVLAGRAAVNSYFNNSPFNCVFMSNTSCLTAYGGISDIGITAFPNSSWAAKVRYDLDKRSYVQLGVFEYNNDLNLKGKGGLDFSLGKGTGALVAGELGYQTTFAQERLPRRYKAGFYLNTDGGTSPFYDINGGSSALTGLARAPLSGSRLGLYGMVDQTLHRAPGASNRNFAVFGRVFFNVGNVQQLDWFASAGFVKTGTFKGRDDDTIGFIVSNTHFSDQQIAYLRDRRARAGGTGSPAQDEVIAELNYGFAALPGLRVLPNVQYVLNPDPIYVPTRKTDVPNALVLGVRVDLKLAQLFGG